MMSAQENYYDILGLPRTATTAEIKKRYRELARKYHPDVTSDKALGAKTFVRISEAYRTLVDPEKRRAYDATLTSAAVSGHAPPHKRGPEPRHSASARPGTAGRQCQVHRGQVDRLVKEAEFAFIRRRFNEAMELCRQAIRLDRSCSRARVILGDIYRLRRQYDHAINEYNYALQFDPSDKETQAKLERLLQRASPLRMSWETPDGRPSNESIILNIIGWSVAFFAVFFIYIYPGRPISWLADYRVPIITNWSWNLVLILFADGMLVGFLLAINGMVDHPDEEFIFESGGRGWGVVPTGLLLLIFSPFFFLGAASAYLFFGFIQDTVSPSILKAFAATAAVVVIAAPMYSVDSPTVLMLGGNLVFTGLVAGWYLGAMLRPER